MSLTFQFILVFLLGLYVGYSWYSKIVLFGIRALITKEDIKKYVSSEERKTFKEKLAEKMEENDTNTSET